MATVSDAPARDGAAPGLGYASPVSERRFARLSDSGIDPDVARVAEEVPAAFVYSGKSHVVMMCSPADLEDLAVGFTLTEEIVQSASDIGLIQVEPHSRGVELRVEIPQAAIDRLALRTRALAGRTGCGLCGVEAIDDAVRIPHQVSSPLRLGADALWRAGISLEDHQPLNRDTRAVHAAAWATSEGTLRVIREDVGRHNALDKVLGALALAGIDPGSGFLVVTSRASFELVQKAAVAGVPLLAAVSRPTGLAIRLADSAGITLVGLLRGRSANVYSHPERLRAGA
ncbi:MAG TPA: formate dehydrogenase accessory sulfurtransferase FdhD [Gemmatimonadaceae bacterium]|nr:formate dehydrogenase accessory sulfurtransferase FdhD [Gemmatimonadaceae bacterium]